MKKKKTASNSTEDSLESQALSLFKATKYKEAIKLYKKLLQSSDNKEWHDQLALCYVYRALSFSNKGMYKEAIVLWDNQKAHSQPPYDAYDHYIIWLIHTNDSEKIKTTLSELSVEQLDKKSPELAAALGLLILTKHPEFEHYLPQDSRFMAHLNLMQTALSFFQEGDLTKLNEALKQLPYRSAFKNLRIILNSILLSADSIKQTQELLAKIPTHSVYYSLSQLILACFLDGSELANMLLQFSQQQRQVIAEIKGLDKTQQEFIEQFCRQHTNLSDKVQFNTAIQYQSLLGVDFSQQFCLTLLASFPVGEKEFNRHFESRNDFEENRIKALKCEQDSHNNDADYYWKLCLNSLDEQAPNSGLKKALILRHMAQTEPEEQDRVELLAQSLEHDANDKICYFHILKYYSQKPENSHDYKHWLTKALDQFPQDTDVLTQAVKTATHNKTYKKACQYANKILKVDPINTFAKQTLFASHIAHAQRLMREKSYHLVEKEISQAEKLNISKAYHQKTHMMNALLYFANEDKQQGLQKIVEHLESSHKDAVNMHFQASIEALLNGLPVATLLRELPPAKDHLLSPSELTEFIEQVKQYALSNETHESLKKALDKVKAPLKKSLLAREYDEALLLNFCKLMDNIGHFELLRHYAKFSHAKWLTPLWMYYRVYSEKNGHAEELSYMDINRLQYAINKSRENNDPQTGLLLENFLNQYYDAHPDQGMGFLEALFGIDDNDDDQSDDPLTDLFGHVSDDIIMQIEAKIETIAKKMSPEKLIKDLTQQVGNNESILMAIMKNPDIFSALLFLKATEQLNIDIGVNIQDIIEKFDISESNRSFPFPF